MAKSLRSKHKRKMRNVKREKYAKKELERLHRIIEQSIQTDVEMASLYTVKSPDDLKKKKTEEKKDAAGPSSMDVDAKSKSYDPKTRQDEHGHYPLWMNQRAIKKHKKKLQGKAKKLKW